MPTPTFTLLVDDDQTTNYLNQRTLEKLAVTDKVLVARNGQQALEQLAAHSQHTTPDCPALIFLDMNMPVMSGLEFLEAYQQLPRIGHAIIIVMLTTPLLPEKMRRLRQLPVTDILNKPLTVEKVAGVLKTYFAPGQPG
ncbi:response regulator [Hymenobacter cavernae]|uniref:Response regulatory domain-containing protein n=1 Tax=Hymenobacter cavernae TaxID=2044852 RepID=A0ABQ1U825_9BACT|nr:response regulator [Hymenobacter cavernae]GGF12342.1 hypothetical protein GCM10011383_24460 [Hymenobacter cavernae]